MQGTFVRLFMEVCVWERVGGMRFKLPKQGRKPAFPFPVPLLFFGCKQELGGGPCRFSELSELCLGLRVPV